MSKLKTCKSCSKEVAKAAKTCPHCGAKLKMGMLLKLVIAGVVIAIIGAVTAPSKEEFKDTLLSLKAESPATIDTADLAAHFRMGSDNTDLQRDKKEEEIKGQIVDWQIPVYEVRVLSADKNKYKIQGTSNRNIPGTFVTIYALDDAEKNQIESLKTGDVVRIKGKITGTTMRNIDIDPAVLAQ